MSEMNKVSAAKDREAIARETLLYVCGCAVRNEIPDAGIVCKADMSMLHQMSKRQLLEAYVYWALSKGSIFNQTDPKISDAWRNDYWTALRKATLMGAEREELIQFLEEKHIWYLPLKGLILKDFYSEYGVRQMSDNDFLFDLSYADAVKDWFLSRGYEHKTDLLEKHDEYRMKPVYNFEMHRCLFAAGETAWADYYQDVKERLQKDAGNGYGYHFSDEDFYIYFIAHACRHLVKSGTGLRTLVDLYLYVVAKTELDWKYIERELRKLGLAREERKMRHIASKVFRDRSANPMRNMTDEEAAYLEIFFSSGTYGTLQNKVLSRLQVLGKPEKGANRGRKVLMAAQYIRRRLFQHDALRRKKYQVFYEHWWLRPILPFYRLGRGIVYSRERMKEEIKSLVRFVKRSR
ncbi:MAG: nucleotidyltransferase family protein [Lachnospiraceae bacterium]|nr:nucleotidyltransferase family protein [Lachnospiraceae bacterium]